VSRLDDRLIAVKRAPTDGGERCRAEARLLASLDLPGLVQFVCLVDNETVELHTVYAGTDTWDRTPPATRREIIEGLTAVASTVADMHELGTAHRSVVPEHVIVGNGHRPVLCGLSDARPLDPISQADDLNGLAGLIRSISGAADEALQSQLETLAKGAAAGSFTARELADVLTALDRDPLLPSSHRRLRVALGSGSVVVVLLVAVALAAPRSDGGSRQAFSTPTITAPTDPRVVRPTSAPSNTAAPTTTTAATPGGNPLELVHEGRRYGLGRLGDVAVIGDWDCNGVRTPALLQFESSTVSVFSVWPDPGAAIAPDSTAVIQGATGLEAVERGECDQLRVLHPNGSTLYQPEFP